jgi:hypothetical protein
MNSLSPIRLLFITISLLLMVVGCASTPTVPYTLETPPLILAPLASGDVKDGRGRFREIYCAIREDHGKLLPEDKPCNEVMLRLANEPSPTGKPVSLGRPSKSNNVRIVIIPGIFSECIARSVSTYSDALGHLRTLGYKTDLIQVGGRSSSAQNAKQIRDFIISKIPIEERLILIGYSKGVPDILETIVDYPELQDRVVAVVSIAGAVGGTPIVDTLSKAFQKLIEDIPITSCPPQDEGGLDSLKPSKRMKWLAEHTLPAQIKYFSLVAFDTPNEISSILRPGYDLLSRIDPRNDSQVVFYDAVIPGSVLMGYIKADHWAIAMPFSRELPTLASTLMNHNAFPREILLEAVVKFVEDSLEGGLQEIPGIAGNK